jgi:threonine dehydrogenase-like Zn-dependent dehydrogenase
MAARAAILEGAERVIVIDRLPERLVHAANIIGTDTVNYESGSVAAELRAPQGAARASASRLRGAQMRGQRYIPEILGLMARGEVRTAQLAIHVMPLEQGPEATGCSKRSKTGASGPYSGPAPRRLRVPAEQSGSQGQRSPERVAERRRTWLR